MKLIVSPQLAPFARSPTPAAPTHSSGVLTLSYISQGKLTIWLFPWVHLQLTTQASASCTFSI